MNLPYKILSPQYPETCKGFSVPSLTKSGMNIDSCTFVFKKEWIPPMSQVASEKISHTISFSLVTVICNLGFNMPTYDLH